MRLGELFLLFLSKKPGTGDFKIGSKEELTVDNALSLLTWVFPDLIDIIKNKRILDFGCGHGYQSAALPLAGADFVVGLEPHTPSIKKAVDIVESLDLKQKVQFTDKFTDEMKSQFDIVISQNSMEHFPDPMAILHVMMHALKQDGKILLTFGPPWYAPYGSHMAFFTKVPWVNILFSEKTVMSVRSRFRDDGATRYEEVEMGLNKMTIAKFERIISQSNLQIEAKKYVCVKRLNFLGKISLLRELFINNVGCILSKNV